LDASIDLKTVLSLLMVVVSVVASSAVAKAKIKDLVEQLKDVELRLRQSNLKMEKLYTMTETQEQRITVLASMSSPDQMRRQHMEQAELETFVKINIKRLQEDVLHLAKMHNSVHPPVPNERKAK